MFKIINLIIRCLKNAFPHYPFLVWDGVFGLDKVGHFLRHCGLTAFAVLVCGANVNGVILYDSLLDTLYEYMNYRSHIGFSLLDILYGRAGMIITLLMLRWIL